MVFNKSIAVGSDSSTISATLEKGNYIVFAIQNCTNSSYDVPLTFSTSNYEFLDENAHIKLSGYNWGYDYSIAKFSGSGTVNLASIKNSLYSNYIPRTLLIIKI